MADPIVVGAGLKDDTGNTPGESNISSGKIYIGIS